MPVYKQGDMWQAFNSVQFFAITTNATIKKDQSLVMGAGIAKQAAQRFPRLPYTLAHAVLNNLKHYERSDRYYGVVSEPYPHLNDTTVLAFQVKYDWYNDASLELIRWSCEDLMGLVGDDSCALNFPGIGKGKLSRGDVKSIIDVLPNNFEVWEYASI